MQFKVLINLRREIRMYAMFFEILDSISSSFPDSVTFPPAKNTVPGHPVAYLVEALLYKPKGSGFDSPSAHWDFSFS
jgi:hypothetical protein